MQACISHCPPTVLERCNRLKMIRVDADPIPAEVIQVVTDWDFTDALPIDKTVRWLSPRL